MTSNESIYFWRETEAEWGFLSQWYSSPFHSGDGKTVFCTAEQWMMYQKAIIFGDQKTATKILATKDPRKQKTLGREVANFDPGKWDEQKSRIVEEGSYHKFKHSLDDGVDLKAMFLATGDRKLIEASPYDRIWGIGYSAKNAAEHKSTWGENLLGLALEVARQKIRDEEKL